MRPTKPGFPARTNERSRSRSGRSLPRPGGLQHQQELSGAMSDRPSEQESRKGGRELGAGGRGAGFAKEERNK